MVRKSTPCSCPTKLKLCKKWGRFWEVKNKSKEDVVEPKGFPSGQESRWEFRFYRKFLVWNRPLPYFWKKKTNLNLHPQLKPNLDTISDEVKRWAQIRSLFSMGRWKDKLSSPVPTIRKSHLFSVCPTAAPVCITLFCHLHLQVSLHLRAGHLSNKTSLK